MYRVVLIFFVTLFVVLLGLAYALVYPAVVLSRFGFFDLLLLSLATFRLTEIVTEEKAAACIRSPFCERVQVTRADGAVEEEEVPSGAGLRKVAGELILCPWCTSVWIAFGLTFLAAILPTAGRVVLLVFSAAGGGMLFQVLVKLIDRARTAIPEQEEAPVVRTRPLDRAA